MSKQETLSKVNGVINTILGTSVEILPSMTAKDIKGWDSLRHIRIIVALEREFKIKFLTSEISSFKSVGDISSIIDMKLNSTRAAS